MDAQYCPLHPSMGPYCACLYGKTDVPVQGTEPHYSIEYCDFNGYPGVRILKNNGPIHAYDEHFQFGVRKAHLLLRGMSIISSFLTDPDKVLSNFVEPLVSGDMQISAYRDFERSSGQVIEKRWLKFEYLSDGVGIGLGAGRCRAVWSVRKELEAWMGTFGYRYAEE